MRVSLAFLALLLAGTAHAQAPSPAQMGITSTTTPEVLQTLDSSKTWVPLGTVDAASHTFSGMGREINLASLGAKCDGTTDDTTAIQAWLGKVAPNTRLVAPPGVCLFTSFLTVGNANYWVIEGAGSYATTFLYTGANTSGDLLTVSDASHGTSIGVTLRNFRIDSTTQMTGGFALHAYALANSALDHVVVAGKHGSIAVTKINGGIWLDGAAGVYLYNPDVIGGGASDGIRVNGSQGANGDAMILSPTVNLFANGLHMGGAFGGVQCGGVGDVRLNGVNILIDTAITGSQNFDFEKLPGCSVDGATSGDSIVINDALTTGGMPVLISGWLGASWYGSAVNVQACHACDIQLSSILASLSCNDGIYIQDQTARIRISADSIIRGNGANGTVHSGQPIGNGTCTTGSGRGYGVNSSAAYANLNTLVTPFSNSAGQFHNITSHPGSGVFRFDPVDGTVIQGNGSSHDVLLQNDLGQLTLAIPTGTKVIALNNGNTVASLPTCNGAMRSSLAVVTDATAPTYNTALTGGGAVIALALCNGGTWVAH